eukprot:jgi/Tetstr1/424259/TSEL_014828.t1
MDGASDDDSKDIQNIKPAAVKPTLDLNNVPIWDSTISTRDNAQAIKIVLGSAGYLDTTKGKGTRQEQMILLAALRHATAHYPMALAILNSISMDSRKCGYTAWKALLTELQGSAMEERKRFEEEITAGQLPNEPVQVYVRRYQNLWNLLNKAHGQWAFEYVAANYLIPCLHPDYDHIVDTTTSAATVNEKLATIISAGQNMEARKRQRQQRVRACPPNLNSYSPRDPQHTTGHSVICRRCDRPGHTRQQCVAMRHANGLRILDDTTPTSTMTNPRYDRHHRAPSERRVNTNYGHHPRDNYRHQAPPCQHFYNDNRNNQDKPQRQQRWTNQGANDGMQRHQQPVGFVSPAGRQHPGHQQASDTFTQRPTGHHEAYPFVGVSPSAQHHSSLPIMLTCTTAAPGGADTGAQEGEGEDSAEDHLHDPWHVPYSDCYADFESPFSHSWHLAGNSECDPGVWTLLAVDGSLLAILCVYVDDIMLATSPSLIWLAVASRPDIAFVVGRLCAYMASPTERHWQIAVSVLRYLKGTPNHGLIFRKQPDNEAPDFLFFVDADWASFVPKRRSTTGYLALVHGTPVAYRAQVQKSVALSTAEAEFVALCMACKCLAFIRVLLRQLHHPTTDPVRVCEDNQACIVQVKHGMITGAQRHIDLKFQYAAQLCQDGVIDMHYTPTADQLADFFTKALPLTTFLHFRAFLMGSSEEPCMCCASAAISPACARGIPQDEEGCWTQSTPVP